MTHTALTGSFDEIVLGPELLGRVCPIEHCGDPLCQCVTSPQVLLLYGDEDEDGEPDAWLAGRRLPEVEVDSILEGLATVADYESWVAAVRAGAILLGVPFSHFTRPDRIELVLQRQGEAWQELPPWYCQRPPLELRRVRAAINELDPMPVVELLKTAYFYGSQTGGGRGPG